MFTAQNNCNKRQIVHDYSSIRLSQNCLIPLEIIYRNGLPDGSSVFKRLATGKVTLKDLGLDHQPNQAKSFPNQSSTSAQKLEETDRYITWAEAQKIAGLTDLELADIKAVLLKADETITRLPQTPELKNEDGKIELAFDDKRKLTARGCSRNFRWMRFTYEGVHVSKEVARQFYKKTGWYNDWAAKKIRNPKESKIGSLFVSHSRQTWPQT